MRYDPEVHNRQSIRLKNFDYSKAGLYFITICTQSCEHLFGEIQDDSMVLNDPGLMIDHQWNELINRFNNIKLHEYVIMPNHFHGIVSMLVEFRDKPCVRPPKNNRNQPYV